MYCRHISIQAPRDIAFYYGMIIIYLQSMDINNFKYTQYNMHIYSCSDNLTIRSRQSLFSSENTECTVQSLSCLCILCVITTFPSHGETLVIVSSSRGTYLNIVPTTTIWM